MWPQTETNYTLFIFALIKRNKLNIEIQITIIYIICILDIISLFLDTLFCFIDFKYYSSQNFITLIKNVQITAGSVGQYIKHS